MNDYVVSATAFKGKVRAFATNTTLMVKEAKAIHALSPIASVALGRTMTAGTMMSKMLKGKKDTTIIQIKGDGPLGGIIVISDSSANIRGYVNNPRIPDLINDNKGFDISTSIGKNSYMNVIKDLGLKEPYIAYSKLLTGDITGDIAHYFNTSEQITSFLDLSVLINVDQSIMNAGGYILQLMPEADIDIVKFIEEKIIKIPSLQELLLQGKMPEDILEIIFKGNDLKINDKYPCRYLCNCSKERIEQAIISLGRYEILSMVDEQKGAHIQCQFCNKEYTFSDEDLIKLAI